MAPARALAILVAGATLCAAEVVAQGPAELALQRRCATQLAQFAELAQRQAVGPRAAEAFTEVVQHYDADHQAARRALGYRRTRQGWQPPRVRPRFVDTANDKQRHRVRVAWHKLRGRLAAAHRDLGVRLAATKPDRARIHWRRALRFDPFDAVARDRLGHGSKVFAGATYRGSAAELAFIATMQGLQKAALTLARRDDYDLAAVATIPAALAVTGQPFHGVRSKHFQVFTRGRREDAQATAFWAERALGFLHLALGAERSERLAIAARQRRYWDWQAFVWTEPEMQALVAANRARRPDPELATHLESVAAQAAQGRFGNIQWFAGPKCREVVQALTPAAMHDRMISSCWEIGIGLDVFRQTSQPYTPNWPLTEGALHAATWFLKSTVITQRGALPKGTAAGAAVQLPKSVRWWIRTMRDQAIAGTDMPLRDVARQRRAAFPNAARLKAWSFMTFLMARHPEAWHDFVLAVPGDKIPFPAEVERASAKALGRSLAEVEAEWRAWASGRSITAIATGYAPPLVPMAPTRSQLEGLRSLNAFRAQAGLPPCELDLEASVACAEHARYLALHEEHQTWPEAHEQDPKKRGFTPRGMRCAMRSVIVIDAVSAKASIEGWMGTIYHRLPLLSPTVRRVGLALVDGMCVLDVGSLEEPVAVDAAGRPTAADHVVWPPDGAKGVERQFRFYELPNPLGDQPPPNNRDDAAGYPISLTMPEHVHRDVTGAAIHLYAMKKRGRGYERGAPVALHVHTPQRPLLARNQTLDTVFGIPVRPLAKKTTYQAVVTLQRGGATTKVRWLFTTDAAPLRRPPK